MKIVQYGTLSLANVLVSRQGFVSRPQSIRFRVLSEPDGCCETLCMLDKDLSVVKKLIGFGLVKSYIKIAAASIALA